MSFEQLFPLWNKLSIAEQQALGPKLSRRTIKSGTIWQASQSECLGLVLLEAGQLRIYINSEEGKEITLYRLFPHDLCLFSAACLLHSIQFSINIEVEKNATLFIIPAAAYKTLMDSNLYVANYTNELMASRFSEVMWLIEQIMWKSLDKRIAAFLVEESRLEDSLSLSITHEKIASHLGSAREVVTRMLRYFQNERLVRLSRGNIEILELTRLRQLSN